ncbi:MAG: hypothetical protein M2R45_00617 [Verrucomicrobia subdivision 3 bacterium]|nr:hypothetical protein [Limisphaerales bacterium]
MLPSVALGTVIFAAGCSKDITVTEIPKERVFSAYQVPDHWKPKAPSAMRAASFEIADEHGHAGEVSVLPMPRLNIADLEIVNLWRQQVGLEPATTERVDELASRVKIGGGDGNLFDLASPDNGEDPDHAARIVTAYLHQDNLTWFFKLTGPSHFVETEKPAFTEFLATINLAKMEREFRSRSTTQTPPQMTSPSRQLPEWEVPAGWQSTPPKSSMLLASFAISDAMDGPAELTVSILGGDGGGLLPNINRWRSQIGLSPLDVASLPEVTNQLDLNGIQGILVDMTGSDNRILAAIIPVGGQTWFYKLMGAPETIEKETVAFTQFVQSVKYPGNG